MNWMKYGLAVLVAAVAASFSDWLFMGVLWHDKYLAHPEVWRRKPGDSAGENKAVMWSCGLSALTCAVFIFACARMHFGLIKDLNLAAVVWLAMGVPIIVGDALFIKIHPRITLAHALGRLAELVIAALAAGLILG
jgi:hypothetical protein